MTTQPVTLVIPPSGFLLDERVFMSLGVLKVAAVLRQAGHEVDVLDLSGVADPASAAAAHAATRRSNTYGITATTPQLPAAWAVRDAVVRQLPYARVILGGPHVTLVHAAAKGEVKRGVKGGRAQAALRGLWDVADVLVAGDGERAVFPALQAPRGTLLDADDPAGPLHLDNAALDAAPFPARDLLDVDSYHFEIDGVRALSLIAQYGCPFACGFCGGRLSPSFRFIRTRTPRRVCEELEEMHRRWGVSGFMFLDDEVNVSPGTVEALDAVAALQDRLGVRFTLRGHVKAQLLTDAQAAALARAGYTWIFVGFESGDERVLRNMQKRATRDENTRCVELARRHGLRVKALMSVGHPGESAETVEATRRWLLEVAPDDLGVSVITTYPGTPYYDAAVETAPGTWTYTAPGGDTLHARDVDYRREQAYFKGAPGSYRSLVHTDALSAEQLVALRDDLEADVRARLGLAWPRAHMAQYEQSMGQAV